LVAMRDWNELLRLSMLFEWIPVCMCNWIFNEAEWNHKSRFIFRDRLSLHIFTVYNGLSSGKRLFNWQAVLFVHPATSALEFIGFCSPPSPSYCSPLVRSKDWVYPVAIIICPIVPCWSFFQFTALCLSCHMFMSYRIIATVSLRITG
jgi:hypothetical protein